MMEIKYIKMDLILIIRYGGIVDVVIICMC